MKNKYSFSDDCLYKNDERLIDFNIEDFQYCCGCTEMSFDFNNPLPRFTYTLKREILSYFRKNCASLIIITLIDSQIDNKKLLKFLGFKLSKRFRNRSTHNFVNVYTFVNKNNAN